MTLSDAMLFGSMDTPQCRGTMSEAGRTCAIGAAMHAVGLVDADNDGHTLIDRWPILATLTRCPVTGMYGSVIGIIVVLNDHHRWTRERIAEWVSGLEPTQAVAVAPLEAVPS